MPRTPPGVRCGHCRRPGRDDCLGALRRLSASRALTGRFNHWQFDLTLSGPLLTALQHHPRQGCTNPQLHQVRTTVRSSDLCRWDGLDDWLPLPRPYLPACPSSPGWKMIFVGVESGFTKRRDRRWSGVDRRPQSPARSPAALPDLRRVHPPAAELTTARRRQRTRGHRHPEPFATRVDATSVAAGTGLFRKKRSPTGGSLLSQLDAQDTDPLAQVTYRDLETDALAELHALRQALLRPAKPSRDCARFGKLVRLVFPTPRRQGRVPCPFRPRPAGR